MTPFDRFLQFLIKVGPSFTIWWLVKLLFLGALLVYLAFAIIVIRQTGLMTKTIDGQINLPLKLVAWLHLAATILIFLMALAIL